MRLMVRSVGDVHIHQSRCGREKPVYDDRMMIGQSQSRLITSIHILRTAVAPIRGMYLNFY